MLDRPLGKPGGTEAAAEIPRLGKLFGRGISYSAIFAVQALSTIFITPAITRAIGPSQFGYVANSLTIVAVVLGFAGMSVQVGIQRHYADEDGDGETRCLVAIVSVISGLVALAFILTGPQWAG